MAPIKKQRLDAILMIGILVSAFLNGFLIWTDDHVNTYYTTTVASMLQSFHNFFFATVDSGGFVTVDKPPVTFWIQTAFAYVLGLHGWSVILPQAFSGYGLDDFAVCVDQTVLWTCGGAYWSCGDGNDAGCGCSEPDE